MISEAITLNELKELVEIKELLFNPNSQNYAAFDSFYSQLQNKALGQQFIQELQNILKKRSGLVQLANDKFMKLARIFEKIFESLN